ncbi:hypothetical protein ACFC0S_17075 [Streptomyces sp. NPDC056084]|uniref:hypothetical protein n=1 Tax=unclassified Streptomyces TaxID=2593676 RepID=UPI0035D55648
MTDNPWPSIAWTAGLIGAIGFLAVWGQHLSHQRAERQRVARTRIPHQRQGDR